MDKFEIEDILRKYKFELAGAILIEEKPYGLSPQFELIEPYKNGDESRQKGWVYLWVHLVGNNFFNICYVGKAGNTIKQRCLQHINGARPSSTGSSKGRKNAASIRDCLNSGGRLELYVRKSNYGEILGEANICLSESEEKAMIQKCNRLGAYLWNK